MKVISGFKNNGFKDKKVKHLKNILGNIYWALYILSFSAAKVNYLLLKFNVYFLTKKWHHIYDLN